MKDMFISHLAEVKGQRHNSKDTILNGVERGLPGRAG